MLCLLSDGIWEQIKQLLPPTPKAPPQIDSRQAMQMTLCVLRTGGQWEPDLEPVFQEWCSTGVFDRMWQVGILTYEELRTLMLRD